MSCDKDGCKEIKGEVKEVKDGNKAEAAVAAKSEGGMPWMLITILSICVIGLLFLAEKKPIGEVLSPETVAKINSVGQPDTTDVADLKVVDKGDSLALVNTKTGKTETTYKKEITVEFKDGTVAKPTVKVTPAPATKEQAEKIEKAVKEVAKAQTSKPAPKEVVKTGGLVRKEIPPLNK